jgi:hypothetical protein
VAKPPLDGATHRLSCDDFLKHLRGRKGVVGGDQIRELAVYELVQREPEHVLDRLARVPDPSVVRHDPHDISGVPQ